MKSPGQAPAVPLRWRLAGLLRRLREFRGRDRIEGLILGRSLPPDGIHEGSIGHGLRYRARYRDDGSFVELFFLQYEPPSLEPILEASLREGGTFFDVGANIGVYSGIASRLVGPSGTVHSFEPVPATRAALEAFVELNGLENVRIIPSAIGSSSGTIELHLVPNASGLASAVHAKDSKFSSRMTVPMIDLDGYSRASGTQPPQLIKIDVEGYEFEAIRGARGLLASDTPPAVVFESQASHFDLAGVSFGGLAAWLDREAGFKVYALLPRGLTAIASPENGPSSTNTLALHPRKHAALHDALRSYRFRRNQNT